MTVKLLLRQFCRTTRGVFLTGLFTFFIPLAAGNLHAAESFSNCLAALRELAHDREINRETFNRLTSDLTPDADTIARLDDQPERILTFAQYRQRIITPERIRRGQQLLRQHLELLRRIEGEYGVDPAILVAIWGVESSYGTSTGRFHILRSLATLSCYGRRQEFFRNEFISALRIVQQGHVSAQNFYGSWAGAFGQTQFLPSSFENSAVDFNGDGRRDIIGDTADALASAANYLHQAGWQRSEGWGFAVAVPAEFSADAGNRHQRRPLSFWSQQGLRHPDGSPLSASPLPQATRTGLLIPARSNDHAFLVLPNFEALFRYNPSEFYALAVGMLADRIR